MLVGLTSLSDTGRGNANDAYPCHHQHMMLAKQCNGYTPHHDKTVQRSLIKGLCPDVQAQDADNSHRVCASLTRVCTGSRKHHLQCASKGLWTELTAGMHLVSSLLGRVAGEVGQTGQALANVTASALHLHHALTHQEIVSGCCQTSMPRSSTFPGCSIHSNTTSILLLRPERIASALLIFLLLHVLQLRQAQAHPTTCGVHLHYAWSQGSVQQMHQHDYRENRSAPCS